MRIDAVIPMEVIVPAPRRAVTAGQANRGVADLSRIIVRWTICVIIAVPDRDPLPVGIPLPALVPGPLLPRGGSIDCIRECQGLPFGKRGPSVRYHI